MPTYEYRCNACKREFEIQQKMSDADLVNCEACGQPKLEKLISWTSVRSNTWQSALTSDNPKEAMKGLRVVDTAPPKKEKPAPAPAAARADAAPAASTDPVAPPEAATEVIMPGDEDDDTVEDDTAKDTGKPI
jgi:putative FmdB family regulatory protein